MYHLFFRHYKDISKVEESKERITERQNRELFTKELVFSLLSPDFESIGITTSTTNNAPQSPDTAQTKTTTDTTKKISPPSLPSDLPSSPSNGNGVSTAMEAHEEDTEEKTDNNENAEISVTRTSINNELLDVASGGGLATESVQGPSGATATTSSTGTDRLFRTKQQHRGASADVLSPDDSSVTRDTRSRSNESVS